MFEAIYMRLLKYLCIKLVTVGAVFANTAARIQLYAFKRLARRGDEKAAAQVEKIEKHNNKFRQDMANALERDRQHGRGKS